MKLRSFSLIVLLVLTLISAVYCKAASSRGGSSGSTGARIGSAGSTGSNLGPQGIGHAGTGSTGSRPVDIGGTGAGGVGNGNTGGGFANGGIGYTPPYRGTNPGFGGGLSSKNTGTFHSYGPHQFQPQSVGLNKGGYGRFLGDANPRYRNTRSTYTNYPQTYNGNYGANGHRSGYVGVYNPQRLYWALAMGAPLGYWYTYQRYNPQYGAYFAPELTLAGNGTSSVQINGTEYSSEIDNYHYMFAISTNKGVPIADHAYFSSADPSTPAADFAYRMTFANIIELTSGDTNSPDSIVAVTPLSNLQWDPIVVTNKTANGSSTSNYLEVTTAAKGVLYNSTGPAFDVYLTWRVSNLQLNFTGSVPLQPNSLQYNFTLVNYPPPTNNLSRIAIHQLLTSIDGYMMTDVREEDSEQTIAAIRSNITYGLSIGEYNHGRVEYESTVNLTQVNWSNDTASIPSAAGYMVEPLWSQSDSSSLIPHQFLATKPHVEGASHWELQGFGFLDTDVLNAMAESEHYSPGPTYSASVKVNSSLLLSVLLSICVIIVSFM